LRVLCISYVCDWQIITYICELQVLENMKNVIGYMVLCLFLMFCVGCEEKEETVGGVPKLDLSTSVIDFATGEKSSQTISMRSTRDWTASCNVQWIALTQTSGKASSNTLSITVYATKNSGSRRETEIVFTNGRVTKTLTVTQAAGK